MVIATATSALGLARLGQFDAQTGPYGAFGVDVDQSTGDVYVVDFYPNGQVQKYDGSSVTSLGSGGALTLPTQVAVNDNAGSQLQGFIYVGELDDDQAGEITLLHPGGNAVFNFDPGIADRDDIFEHPDALAVGPQDNVYFAVNSSSVVKRFGPDGTGETAFVSSGLSSPSGLALDDSGNLYVADEDNGVLKFDSSGSRDNSLPALATGLNPSAVDVNASGQIHVFVDTGSDRRVITYDSAGNQTDVTGEGDFDPNRIGGERGMAYGDAAELLYVPQGAGSGIVLEYGVLPPGPPTISGETEQNVGGDSAELHADVNPTKREMTGCEFQYVDDTAFQTDGYASATSVPCDPQPTGSGASPIHTSALLHPLQGNTTYHWRVVASNDFSGGSTTTGPDQTFTTGTPNPPTIDRVRTANLTGTSVILRARVNPNDSLITDCHFEWGTGTGYGNSADCDPMPVTGTNGVQVKAEVDGLADNTAYHWQVFATNNQGSDSSGDQTFTTPKLPTVTLDPPTNIGPHSADFSGTINPEGHRVRYRFEYSTDGFETIQEAPGFTPSLQPNCGTEPSEISESALDLSPNSAYEVRLRAEAFRENCNGSDIGTAYSAPQAFSTPAIAPSVTPGTGTAGKESATIRGYVNPNNQATTYYFEWGPDTGYGNRTELPDPELPAVDDPTLVTHELTGLDRNSTYHYRVVAENATGVTEGPDQSVTTTNNGLINDREIELVTPAEGLGASVLPVAYGSAAIDGETFAWHSRVPSGEDAEGAPLLNTYFATRTADGWESKNVSPFVGASYTSSNGLNEYKHLTPDFSHGIFFAPVGGPDALSSAPDQRDLFTRSLPDGGYSLLSPEPVEEGTNRNSHQPVFLVGYADDLSHVFIEPPVDVQSAAACDGAFDVPCDVTPATGEAVPVAFLPEHHQEIVVESPLNPRRDDGGEFTLSFDGQETAPLDWIASADDVQAALEALPSLEAGQVEVTGGPRPSWNPRRLAPYDVVFGGPFFNADTPELSADGSALTGGTTIEAGYKGLADSAAIVPFTRSGVVANRSPHRPESFSAVSSDGTRAVFEARGAVRGTFIRDTSVTPPRTLELAGGFITFAKGETEIINSSGRFDIASGELTEFDPGKGPAGSLTGDIVRVSEDGSHIYFVTGDRLLPADLSRGPDIYLWRDDGTPQGELQYVGELGNRNSRLGHYEGAADITPDGRFLIFASTANQTGYDEVGGCNNPTASQLPYSAGACPQVYVFDAQAPQGDPKKLQCASCHPDGEDMVGGWRIDVDKGTLGYGDTGLPLPYKDRITEPRYISDDGESVFFQSHEPLLARDTNGTADIYEYDVPSGQLSLVTTGKPAPGMGIRAATFEFDVVRDGFWILDSSQDGDVFFVTGAALTPRDQDDLPDVYVARAGGGLPAPQPDQDCQGSECQGDPEPAPDEEAIGSSTATGEGNLDPEAQRCQRLVSWFQDLKTRFLRLKVAYFQADTAAERRLIRRRAIRVKRKAIQVRQAAIECRENL